MGVGLEEVTRFKQVTKTYSHINVHMHYHSMHWKFINWQKSLAVTSPSLLGGRQRLWVPRLGSGMHNMSVFSVESQILDYVFLCVNE